MAKILVGKTDDIEEGKLTHVQAGGKEVLVANVKGNYYAMGNICTHAGAELHEGVLEGKELTCPWHGAKFDIRTGEVLGPPAYDAVVRYDVRVTGGDIEIAV